MSLRFSILICILPIETSIAHDRYIRGANLVAAIRNHHFERFSFPRIHPCRIHRISPVGVYDCSHIILTYCLHFYKSDFLVSRIHKCSSDISVISSMRNGYPGYHHISLTIDTIVRLRRSASVRIRIRIRGGIIIIVGMLPTALYCADNQNN